MKLPFAFSVTDPCAGLLTRIAVSASPSTSLSFASTPAAATFNAVSSLVLYASFAATGASFTAVTVMLTVAAAESTVPSFALNVKLSLPL